MAVDGDEVLVNERPVRFGRAGAPAPIGEVVERGAVLALRGAHRIRVNTNKFNGGN